MMTSTSAADRYAWTILALVLLALLVVAALRYHAASACAGVLVQRAWPNPTPYCLRGNP